MSKLRMYPIRYRVEFGAFTKDDPDFDRQEMGMTEAVIVHSIIYPPDGSRDEMLSTRAPDGNPMTDIEIFKSWITMAYGLSNSESLPEFQKQMAKTVFDTVKEAITEARKHKLGPEYDVLN